MAKKTIPRTCEHCQAAFLAEAYDVNGGRARFCSNTCSNRFKRRDAPSVKRDCQLCGNEFFEFPSQIKLGRGVFCSAKCKRRSRGTLQERFWAKVNKNAGQGPKGECWQWTASMTKGYGSFNRRGAHQVSWEIHNGIIPHGLCVLHRCDNPPCVNPAHLFLGTKKDNSHDMVQKGRWRTGKAQLTAAKVKTIRRLRAEGATLEDLGILYDRHPHHIHRIVKGHEWKTGATVL